jgi:hypothetical protein
MNRLTVGTVQSLMAPESPAATLIKAGTAVTVTRDDGSLWQTRTRSDPWQLGDGTWVVALEGRAGGFRLDRVQLRVEND